MLDQNVWEEWLQMWWDIGAQYRYDVDIYFRRYVDFIIGRREGKA